MPKRLHLGYTKYHKDIYVSLKLYYFI